uniref:HTH_Tnp_Tc3_1 domain-containing protein n=1 Tax=Heterorhabditis bacteriophora TaxID=37862 RepID=A0A1I7XC76_HETBA
MANMPSVDQFRKPKMACGSLLDDIEKGKILPFPDIAREIGRSRNVVANFLRAPADQKKARMDFARTHVMDFGMDWDNSPFFHVHVPFDYKLHFIQIIFGDEKKSSPDGPDGFTSYWRDLRKERRLFSTRNSSFGSLWGILDFKVYTHNSQFSSTAYL